jgi:allophanate hydrolase subunit 2
MGLRLEGPPLQSKSGMDIISDGIPPGAVQVPESGKPIILLADRQTVGGYAKPWVVISADLPKLAQARPGTKLRFAYVSPARAGRILKNESSALASILSYNNDRFFGQKSPSE